MKPYKNKKSLKSLDSWVSLISFLSDYYEHDRTSLIFDERLDELEDDGKMDHYVTDAIVDPPRLELGLPD